MAKTEPGPTMRMGWWYDPRIRSLLCQACLAAALGLGAWICIVNAATNIDQRGLRVGFGFLGRPSGFGIADPPIPYDAGSSYALALAVGLVNTVRIALLGIGLATVLGVAAGIGLLSPVKSLALALRGYVELARNTPLLLQLFFWYALLGSLGGIRQAWNPLPGVYLSNRGLVLPAVVFDGPPWLLPAGAVLVLCGAALLFRHARRIRASSGRWPRRAIGACLAAVLAAALAVAGWLRLEVPVLEGFDFSGGLTLTPEFAALLTGLVFYTSAFIAEIVRAGIAAVPRGQTEAGRALGLSRGRILGLIVLPQALRTIIPPLTSQYVSLTKNSSLAVAIGFPDFVSIANTTINQAGQAMEMIAILALVYLLLNVTIAGAMAALDRLLTGGGRTR